MSQTFGPYSKIAEAKGLLFTAGQVGVDFESKRAPIDFSAQMHLAIQNLKDALLSEHLGLDSVKNVRIYLTSMQNFEAMNKIFAEYFTDVVPSRECVAVKELPPVANNPLLIEISVVAEKA